MFKAWKKITAAIAAVCCLMTIIPSTLFVSADTIKYEGEDGKISSGSNAQVKEDDVSSGGKYIELKDEFEIEYTVNVESAGYYDFKFVARCNVGDQYKANYISANGGSKQEFAVEKSTYDTITTKNVKLNAGDNTVTISQAWGWTDVDYFTVEKAETSDKDYYNNVESTPVNPNATASAKRLKKYLADNYGKYIISGQQSDTGYESNDVQAIKSLTGELPAIIGLDLMDYSLSSVKQHDAQGASIDRAIEVADAGGIVTMCWHWRMYDEYLKSGTDNGSPRWWGAFYTKNVDTTKFDLAKIMDDPSCTEYKLLVSDIDYVAEQLKKLQEKGIPVLFRPLHEGGGNYNASDDGSGAWFWWGTGGSEAYIKLWKLMYDRITNVAGVNNLIWVWNGQVPSYYPGNEYVDIIGEDVYNSANDYQPNSERFINANEYTSASKMVALTENGTLIDPDEAFEINAKWSYFCSWTGNYSANGEYNNADNKAIWKKVYNSDKVITLSELPNIKTYPIDDDIAATDIKLDTTSKELTVGEKFTLAATFTPENATEIPTWSSSDTNVATVNDSGEVTTVGIGEAVITAKVANGKTATCTVTVKPLKVTDLTVKSKSSTSVTLTWKAVDGADNYEVTLMDADGKTLKTYTADSNTYEVKELTSGTTYKFRVRAHKTYNSKDLYGDYSAIVTAETDKSSDSSQPTKINSDESKKSTEIPTIKSNNNTNNNGTTSINTVNNSDNSANTGTTAAALTTLGLAVAGAIIVIAKKKK